MSIKGLLLLWSRIVGMSIKGLLLLRSEIAGMTIKGLLRLWSGMEWRSKVLFYFDLEWNDDQRSSSNLIWNCNAACKKSRVRIRLQLKGASWSYCFWDVWLSFAHSWFELYQEKFNWQKIFLLRFFFWETFDFWYLEVLKFLFQILRLWNLEILTWNLKFWALKFWKLGLGIMIMKSKVWFFFF